VHILAELPNPIPDWIPRLARAVRQGLWIDFCWSRHAGGSDGSFRDRSRVVVGRSSGGLDARAGLATSGATDGQYWRDRSVATAANIGAPGTRSSVSEDQNAKCALFSV